MHHPVGATPVTVVRTSACHFCEDAVDALAALGSEFPLDVELIDASEPRGVALLRGHRAAMFPFVLVDGRYFSVGRLPRRKLRALLERQGVAASAGNG